MSDQKMVWIEMKDSRIRRKKKRPVRRKWKVEEFGKDGNKYEQKVNEQFQGWTQTVKEVARMESGW